MSNNSNKRNCDWSQQPVYYRLSRARESGEGTQYNYDTHQFLTKIYQNFKASFNITFCLENFHFNKYINTSSKVLI